MHLSAFWINIGREKSRKSGGTFTIVSPLNDHGALTVRARDTNATYQVVEFATPELRERVAGLPAGNDIRLGLRRAGIRANVWCAEGVYPDTTSLPQGSVS
jgi:hypothetical protein